MPDFTRTHIALFDGKAHARCDGSEDDYRTPSADCRSAIPALRRLRVIE